MENEVCQLRLTEDHSVTKPLKFVIMASCDRTSAETEYGITDVDFKKINVEALNFWSGYEFPSIRVSN